MAKSHFGEILQGVFLNEEGLYIKASVVALIDQSNPPKNHLSDVFDTGESGSVATFSINGEHGLEVTPVMKTKSRSAAYKTLLEIDSAHKGVLKIATGKDTCSGMGRSTSDVVSSIRAICNYYDIDLSQEKIAKIAVNSEFASDGVMFDKAILFATEKAQVLRYYNTHYPDLEVLGLDCSKGKYDLNTLHFPPRNYTEKEKNRFYELELSLRKALTNRNFNQLAEVATESAVINQKYLPKDHFEEFKQIADHHNLPGIICSHSGTVMGMLINPVQIPSLSQLKAVRSDLESIGFNNMKRYSNYATTS